MAKNNSSKYLSEARTLSGYSSFPSNEPAQYSDRQKQYLGERTRIFADRRAYLASNYIAAEVQGVTEDFYSYLTLPIRMADLSSPRASLSQRTDDFKEILIPDCEVDYLPLGAKIKAMGSTWLAIDPSNISSVNTTSVVARCNASYNDFDDYGNVVTEPIVISKVTMSGNDDSLRKNLVLMEGYFNVTCQLNDNTCRLGHNQRLILGTKAYHISGYTDFIQEFTGNRNSVHILTFTVHLEEPTENDDVSENFIANAKTRSFAASLSGVEEIMAGQTASLPAQFVRDGKAVVPTQDQPVTWDFISSDETILTVDASGMVTAKAAGDATVIAILKQNRAITATHCIHVKEASTSSYVAFLGHTDTTVSKYRTALYYAAFFDGGNETEEPLRFDFSGAKKENYSVEINDRSVTILCLDYDPNPLTITASHGESKTSISIHLEGFG